eukprot:1717403-Prymnesium_polylepis.1
MAPVSTPMNAFCITSHVKLMIKATTYSYGLIGCTSPKRARRKRYTSPWYLSLARRSPSVRWRQIQLSAFVTYAIERPVRSASASISHAARHLLGQSSSAAVLFGKHAAAAHAASTPTAVAARAPISVRRSSVCCVPYMSAWRPHVQQNQWMKTSRMKVQYSSVRVEKDILSDVSSTCHIRVGGCHIRLVATSRAPATRQRPRAGCA